MTRLILLAMLMMPVTCWGQTEWLVTVRHSEIDGNTDRVFRVRATRPVKAWLRSVTPTLYVRCSTTRAPAAFIDNGTAASIESAEHLHTIRLRWDDQDADEESWSESNDGYALFSIDSKITIANILDSKKLFYEFLPFNAPGRVETNFRVAGLRGLMQRYKECSEVLAQIKSDAEQDARRADERAENARNAALPSCTTFYNNRTGVPERCKAIIELFDRLRAKCIGFYVQNGVYAPKPSYTIPADCRGWTESDFNLGETKEAAPAK